MTDTAQCPHMHLIRVLEIGSDEPREPQNGTFTYYCQGCHLSLYVRFTDPPPVVVTYGRPKP